MTEPNRPVPPVKAGESPCQHVNGIDDDDSALIKYLKRKTGKTGRTIAAFCLIANVAIVSAPSIWFAITRPFEEQQGQDAFLSVFEGLIAVVVGCALIIAAGILVIAFAGVGLAFAIDGITSSKSASERIRSWIYLLLHAATLAVPAWFIVTSL